MHVRPIALTASLTVKARMADAVRTPAIDAVRKANRERPGRPTRMADMVDAPVARYGRRVGITAERVARTIALAGGRDDG